MATNHSHRMRVRSLSFTCTTLLLASACGSGGGREVVAELPDVHRLQVGDSVYYQGLGVGSVRAVDLAGAGAQVHLALGRADVPLRATDRVRVRANGAFGAVVVDLVPTSTTAPLLVRRRGIPDTLAAAPYVPPDPVVEWLARWATESLRTQLSRP